MPHPAAPSPSRLWRAEARATLRLAYPLVLTNLTQAGIQATDVVMLGSAVCSQISTEELTFAANFIQSRNFRAFETYLLTTLIYLLMAIGVRQALHWLGVFFIVRRR